jgi:hypothetical protein
MLELCSDLDLAEESVWAERNGQLGAQHLYRNLAMMPEVLGQIDRGHPSASDLALNAITVCEGGS